ncbi:MAG: methyltransferase domain-containing protein [Elusimicrobia bacterium]|nr:methyltransferase domain-containing protein [Elusimicrobiota bacterium]
MELKKWEKKVAGLYNRKKRDFNYLLANDSIIHHHNGICRKNLKKPKTQETLLNFLHKAETDTSLYGFRFFSKFKTFKNKKILDAGCGRGGSSILMASKFKGAEIKGINISDYQLLCARRIAKKKVKKNISFFKRSMLNTRFAKSQFDMIWACESTEHLSNLKDWFSEADRIASKKARMIIIAWVKNEKNPKALKYSKLIDAAYTTCIHFDKEYEETYGRWKLKQKIDLTDLTVPYWRIRKMAESRTGTEKFMLEAFEQRAALYRLYVYDLV